MKPTKTHLYPAHAQLWLPGLPCLRHIQHTFERLSTDCGHAVLSGFCRRACQGPCPQTEAEQVLLLYHECLVQVYTTKTDVWSFGVMLTELCNQELPYSSLFLTPLQVAIGVADRKLRPPLENTNIPDAVKRLLDSCLQQEPMLRPSFVFIASQLHPVVQALRAAEARADAQPSLLGRMSSMLSGVAVQASGAAASMRETHTGSTSTGTRTPAPLPPRPESADRTPSGSRSHRSTGRGSIDGGRFSATGSLGGARAQASSMFSGFMNRARAGMQR